MNSPATTDTEPVPPAVSGAAALLADREGSVPQSGDTGSPIPPALLQGSLRNSIKDASAWAVMQGAGTNYLMPFVVLRGHGLLYIAAFNGLPLLAGAVVQWWAANITDRIGRRNRVIVGSALAQAITWLPICVAVFLPPASGYWLMLAAYVLLIGLANSGAPAWQSLMGDLVPADRRGRYFGVRNALANGVLTLSFFAAGWWLTLCERSTRFAVLGLEGRPFGFLVLFAVSGAARLLSTWYLSRIHEPAYRHQPRDRFSLLQFLRRAPKAHFGRFAFYCAAVALGTGLVLPLLPWYFLEQLRLGPGQFAAIMAAGMLSGVVSLPLWGRLNDRVGSKRVLVIGGVGTVAVPLALLVCDSFWQFILAMAYDGIATAAYTMAVGNYLYDVVTPPKRARCGAYLALFVALGTVMGNLGGALLAELAPPLIGAGATAVAHPFGVVLVVSAVVRLLANLLLLGSFAEFRLARPCFTTASMIET